MRALNASQVLSVWERAIDCSLPRRAIMLLAAACPESSWNELVALPLGRREQLLMQLREQLFGSSLTLIVPCPACSERLESTLLLADLRIDAPAGDVMRSLSVGDHGIRFRPPTAGDLIDLPADAQQACIALLSRCMVDAPTDGTAGIEAMAADEIRALADSMAAADPQANIDIGMTCTACGHHWACAFDIASFLWREIDAWAQRTLRDVHTLARAYAWSEQAILALSPTRRQVYLELSRS
ncbi:MAG TPA: hypothetical protein VFI49_14505 [Rudaea sp.]|nr:hypothetical protein [Rudaea sp.]